MSSTSDHVTVQEKSSCHHKLEAVKSRVSIASSPIKQNQRENGKTKEKDKEKCRNSQATHLPTLAYLCTQTNYIPFVRCCSHYTIAESVVVPRLLNRIYPSHSPFHRSLSSHCSLCFADSSDNDGSAVECLCMTWNKDSIYPNCSILHTEWFRKWKCVFKVAKEGKWRSINALKWKSIEVQCKYLPVAPPISLFAFMLKRSPLWLKIFWINIFLFAHLPAFRLSRSTRERNFFSSFIGKSLNDRRAHLMFIKANIIEIRGRSGRLEVISHEQSLMRVDEIYVKIFVHSDQWVLMV